MSTTFSRRAASVAAAAALGLVGAAPATAHQTHGAEHHGHGHSQGHDYGHGHGYGHKHGHGHGHSKRIDYVNLGDSYSAAIGTGGITASPLGSECLQGDGPDHVSALDARKRVQLILDGACAGATTDDIQAIAGTAPVAHALRKAELVTLTLGGNDVGWTQYLQACSVEGEATAPTGTCDALIGQAQTRIEAAALSASETVGTIDEATTGRIVVLGYPHIFDGEQDTAFFSAERVAQLNTLTDALNEALAEAVTDQRRDVVFVDVSERFAGHGADSTDPWIYFNPADPTDPNNLHPNEQGYLDGYYAALTSEVDLGHRGH